MSKLRDEQALARITKNVREAVANNSKFWRSIISHAGQNHFFIQEQDGREVLITIKQTMPPEDER